MWVLRAAFLHGGAKGVGGGGENDDSVCGGNRDG